MCGILILARFGHIISHDRLVRVVLDMSLTYLANLYPRGRPKIILQTVSLVSMHITWPTIQTLVSLLLVLVLVLVTRHCIDSIVPSQKYSQNIALSILLSNRTYKFQVFVRNGITEITKIIRLHKRVIGHREYLFRRRKFSISLSQFYSGLMEHESGKVKNQSGLLNIDILLFLMLKLTLRVVASLPLLNK